MGVCPTLVSSSSSNEKQHYLRDNNIDWDVVHSASDTNKHFHLAEEEMQVAALGTESSSGETSFVEGIFSFLNYHRHFF